MVGTLLEKGMMTDGCCHSVQDRTFTTLIAAFIRDTNADAIQYYATR